MSETRTRGLSPETRRLIDLALLDVYRAAWEGEREAHPTVLRSAYLQGRVDQERLQKARGEA